MKMFLGMSNSQIEEFILSHPVSGGCGTHGAENAAANQQSAFTSQMLSQATSVFGSDSTVFNNMMSAYSSILAAGPSQQGFSQAQQNAMNASAITNNANQYRFAAGSVKSGQAGYGGGNSVNNSGVNTNQNTQIAEAAAANTDKDLNSIQQANWAQGNQDWQIAGKGMESAPSVFGNLSGVDSAAQTGLNQNMQNAKAKDASSNWWVAPVMGLANAGLSLATGGISSAMTGGGGMTSSFNGGSIGGMSDPALGTISGMPNGSGGPGLGNAGGIDGAPTLSGGYGPPPQF